MRLVSAVLFVALTGSWALADEVKPADPKPEVTKKKVPYRVVKTLPETGQVLLFDKVHGSHVVAEVGEDLDDGYTIEDIDDDEVTLVAANGAQVILTSPPPPRQPKRAAKKPVQPVDPYAEPGAEGVASAPTNDSATKDAAGRDSAAAPQDPYADPEAPTAAGEGGIRIATATDPADVPTVSATQAVPSATSSAPPPSAPASSAAAAPTPAPIVDAGPPAPADPYGHPGIAAFAEAVGASEQPAVAPTPKPAKPAKPAKVGKKKAAAPTGDDASALAAAATGGPAPSPTAATTAATATPAASSTAGTTMLTRAELDAALADFGKLASTFRATFTADGLRFDSISDGTLLTKIGLRKGDVITYVDSRPMRSLDDAASLYARASSVRNTTIQLTRDGKVVTLRIAIQ